jgi:hypothetical protein
MRGEQSVTQVGFIRVLQFPLPILILTQSRAYSYDTVNVVK